tara:strand:+ start:3566 stop:5083 length:1518 start_codon:yes stop_codon:yes gene_type:complete
MAQRFYKIDLRDSLFPMLSEQQTRTTIGASDGESPTKEDKPGVAYCHNVMPSAYGFDSIGYKSVVAAATLPVGLSLTDVRVAFGNARSRLHLGWDTEGGVYALLDNTTAWLALPATVPATGGAGFSAEAVTTGTVNGVSYIFYSGIGAFTYNEATNQLDNVILTGISIPVTLGVVASSGYLIAYTDSAIAWSSTLVPTDFVPSSVTGAGGGNVAGIAGDILFCTANTLGVLVYTAANTIAGTYTGNTQFPFKFREVDNSKGGVSLDRVAYEANSSEQFVFSKAGLQAMSSRAAKHILPDVTDFLAGRRFEDYNEVTKQYEVTDLAPTATMLKKIKYVASRYLVISYGITSFTHALVLDTALSKLGKLRLTHTDCFEYVSDQTEIAKESLAFMLGTGEVQVVDFSTGAASSGVLILGKIQFVRSHMITLLGVELENVETGSSLTVEDQAALDGKNFTNVTGTLTAASAGDLREYVFRSSAKNHSLVFTGKFNLVTAQVRYSVTGRR